MIKPYANQSPIVKPNAYEPSPSRDTKASTTGAQGTT